MAAPPDTTAQRARLTTNTLVRQVHFRTGRISRLKATVKTVPRATPALLRRAPVIGQSARKAIIAQQAPQRALSLHVPLVLLAI